MSKMTYRDIPVLRSAGFEVGPSGWTWSKKDMDGNLWIVSEDEEDTNKLSFTMVGGPSVRLTRQRFDELFVKART
jgi:hypothetical protein